MKTRKIVKKRFKFTKTGKIKRKTCTTSHLNRKNTVSKSHRKNRDQDIVGKFAAKIRKMIND